MLSVLFPSSFLLGKWRKERGSGGEEDGRREDKRGMKGGEGREEKRREGKEGEGWEGREGKGGKGRINETH